MNVPNLSKFLSPILTVASVLNTGETGDKNGLVLRWDDLRIKMAMFLRWGGGGVKYQSVIAMCM